ARLLGVENPPETVAQLHGQLQEFRTDLVVTPSALESADFVIHNPPVAALAKPGFALLTSGAISLLPGFARDMVGLNIGPNRAHRLYRPIGKFATSGLRWSLGGIDKFDRLPPDFAHQYRKELGQV